MVKRLSNKQKEEIIELFTFGKNLDELSYEFQCTKLTISRNLKKHFGEKKYKELINKYKSIHFEKKKEEKSLKDLNTSENKVYEDINNQIVEESIPLTPFTEIIPLDLEIEGSPQKDLSSIPISEANFPSIVYMIVDKKIELETKYLKEYPDWQFLSQEELNRNTIQIYIDLKIAKKFCNKDQKVIKVPNTDVFKIAAPFLLRRGISRIVSEDKLIAL